MQKNLRAKFATLLYILKESIVTIGSDIVASRFCQHCLLSIARVKFSPTFRMNSPAIQSVTKTDRTAEQNWSSMGEIGEGEGRTVHMSVFRDTLRNLCVCVCVRREERRGCVCMCVSQTGRQRVVSSRCSFSYKHVSKSYKTSLII